MRLNGKLTVQEAKDLGRLVRSRSWRKALARNLYGLFFVGVLLWISAAAVLSDEAEYWRFLDRRVLVGVWAGTVALVCWAAYRTHRAQVREMAALNANLPKTIEVDGAGMRAEGIGGATASRAWNTVTGWRSSGSVILLDLDEPRRFVVLPLEGLSSTDRELLRDLLSYLVGDEKNG
jgi:hypothetical protein